MARSTAADFVAYVREFCGNPTTDELSDARILQTLNCSKDDICIRYSLPSALGSFDLDLVPGQQEYSLATDAGVTDVMMLNDGIIVSTGQRVTEMNQEMWKRYNASATSNKGDPFKFFRLGADTL